jgi:hypothetical protein
MERVAALAVWLFGAAPLAAQWSAGVEVGMLRFWGTSIDTVTPGDPTRARPSPSTSFSVKVQRDFGWVGVGIGVLYSKGGAGVENATVAVEEKNLIKVYEVAPEVSFRITMPGAGGALRLRVGPLFDRWSFTGGDGTRRRVGARAAVSLDWPLGGRWTGSLQGGAAVSTSVFNVEDLPPEFGRQVTWRRAVSAGLQVRL